MISSVLLELPCTVDAVAGIGDGLQAGLGNGALALLTLAEAAMLDALESGSHIVVSDDLYGGTFRLFDRVRRRSANLEFTYVDLTNASQFESAIKQNTRMVWIETPSNPLLKLIDLGLSAFQLNYLAFLQASLTALESQNWTEPEKIS